MEGDLLMIDTSTLPVSTDTEIVRARVPIVAALAKIREQETWLSKQKECPHPPRLSARRVG